MNKSRLSTHIVILAVAAAFIALALGISPLSELKISSDAAYPLLIAVLSLGFALWIIVDDRRKVQEKGEDVKVFDKDVFVTIGIMALYALLLFFVGYIISTLVFTTVSIWYLYKRQAKIGLLVGFIATFMVVSVFKYGFSVILP